MPGNPPPASAPRRHRPRIAGPGAGSANSMRGPGTVLPLADPGEVVFGD